MIRVLMTAALCATAAILGKSAVEGAKRPADLKDLVLSAPDYWELTTRPQKAGPQ